MSFSTTEQARVVVENMIESVDGKRSHEGFFHSSNVVRDGKIDIDELSVWFKKQAWNESDLHKMHKGIKPVRTTRPRCTSPRQQQSSSAAATALQRQRWQRLRQRTMPLPPALAAAGAATPISGVGSSSCGGRGCRSFRPGAQYSRDDAAASPHMRSLRRSQAAPCAGGNDEECRGG